MAMSILINEGNYTATLKLRNLVYELHAAKDVVKT